MKISIRTLAIFAIVAANGVIWTMTVSQPADAWHTIFGSKKDCTNYMTTVNGNTNRDAQFMCQKVIPH